MCGDRLWILVRGCANLRAYLKEVLSFVGDVIAAVLVAPVVVVCVHVAGAVGVVCGGIGVVLVNFAVVVGAFVVVGLIFLHVDHLCLEYAHPLSDFYLKNLMYNINKCQPKMVSTFPTPRHTHSRSHIFSSCYGDEDEGGGAYGENVRVPEAK